MTFAEVEGSAPTAPPSTWVMLRAMVGVGLLCGLLISTAYLTTRPAIERNQAEALQRAIFEVLPAATASRTHLFRGDVGFVPVGGAKGAEAGSDGELVHVAYDDAGAVVGVAIEAAGMGYQDVIRVLYGYAPERSAIVGIRVLESRETPGLGDRIETDPDFQANFRRLDVSLTADQDRIAHPIEAVKHGEKTEPWQIDGITGATISAEAIASILARSTAVWIPRVRRGLDVLKAGPGG